MAQGNKNPKLKWHLEVDIFTVGVCPIFPFHPFIPTALSPALNLFHFPALPL